MNLENYQIEQKQETEIKNGNNVYICKKLVVVVHLVFK